MLDLCPVSILTTGEDRKQQSDNREDPNPNPTDLRDAITITSVIFSFSTVSNSE